jgi:hypothetical protein
MVPALHGSMREVPPYSRGERVAAAIVHTFGFTAALAACAVLAIAAPRPAGEVRLVVALGPQRRRASRHARLFRALQPAW